MTPSGNEVMSQYGSGEGQEGTLCNSGPGGPELG